MRAARSCHCGSVRSMRDTGLRLSGRADKLRGGIASGLYTGTVRWHTMNTAVEPSEVIRMAGLVERLKRLLQGRRRTPTTEEKLALEERRAETNKYWQPGHSDPGIRSDKPGWRGS